MGVQLRNKRRSKKKRMSSMWHLVHHVVNFLKFEINRFDTFTPEKTIFRAHRTLSPLMAESRTSTFPQFGLNPCKAVLASDFSLFLRGANLSDVIVELTWELYHLN